MFSFFFYLLLTIFIIISLFLILLILIQKGRGGGLASAFGGAGGNTAFGAKTGDVLTWATSIVFGLFLVLAVVLNLMAHHAEHKKKNPTVANARTSQTAPETQLPPANRPEPDAAPIEAPATRPVVTP